MSLWSKLFGAKRTFTDEASERIQNNIASGKAVMLDVRSQGEWDNGHLRGAIFIPITLLKSLPPETDNISELDRTKIIYCH